MATVSVRPLFVSAIAKAEMAASARAHVKSDFMIISSKAG
jgi:hypothetical protein